MHARVSKPLLKYNFRSAKRYVIQLILYTNTGTTGERTFWLSGTNRDTYLRCYIALYSTWTYRPLAKILNKRHLTVSSKPIPTLQQHFSSRKHRDSKSWNHISVRTGRTFEKRKNKHIRSTEKIWEKFNFNSCSFTSRWKLLNETAMTTWRALE